MYYKISNLTSIAVKNLFLHLRFILFEFSKDFKNINNFSIIEQILQLEFNLDNCFSTNKYLIRIYKAGIPCPEPILLRSHVLLMDFLGVDGWPAPRLKEPTLIADLLLSFIYFHVNVLKDLFFMSN